MKYLKLIRIKHYIKNALIFLPLIFSGMMTNFELFVNTFLGALTFCFLSSTIYIINDIRDIENDRAHPTKRKRPIASGEIPVKTASIIAGILLIISFITNYCVARFDIMPWAYAILYFLLNIAYSMGLKNVPIADIAILVSGFLIRVLYGSVITGIEISNWLYLSVMSMSFYLGLGKRRNELARSSNGSSRKVLKFYTYGFLDKNMYMCLALTVMFYSLWSIDKVTVARTGNSRLIWSVPLLILCCMKYSLNIESNSDGDPVEVILHDKMLIFLSGFLMLFMIAVIYF